MRVAVTVRKINEENCENVNRKGSVGAEVWKGGVREYPLKRALSPYVNDQSADITLKE